MSKTYSAGLAGLDAEGTVVASAGFSNANARDIKQYKKMLKRAFPQIVRFRTVRGEKLAHNPKRAKVKRVVRRRVVARKRRVVRPRVRKVKRETLVRNPAKTFLIEAMTLKGMRPVYFYWDDPGQHFVSQRAHASPYKSEKAARIEAKKLLPKLPRQVCSLRTVPA